MGSSVPKYCMICCAVCIVWHGKSNHIHKHTRSSFFARLVACLHVRIHLPSDVHTGESERLGRNQYAGTHITDRQLHIEDFHVCCCCRCCLFFFGSFQFYWVDLLCCSTHSDGSVHRVDRMLPHLRVWNANKVCARMTIERQTHGREKKRKTERRQSTERMLHLLRIL